MSFTIRQLSGHEEYRECVRLQQETWGEGFSECVPPTMLMVSQMMGGVAAGAFDESGGLVGLVFGLTGIRKGRRAHWSDLLAVRPELRDQGLGLRLKLFQRQAVLEVGVESMYWTYDPLVGRNAHLNLNRLGAEIDEYETDFYPNMDSKLHQGLGMDRFIVCWNLTSDRVGKRLSGEPVPLESSDAPVVNARVLEEGRVEPLEADLPDLPQVRIEIPEDIQALKVKFPKLGAAWRSSTRRAFQWYLGRGYRVSKYYRCRRSRRCFYVCSS